MTSPFIHSLKSIQAPLITLHPGGAVILVWLTEKVNS